MLVSNVRSIEELDSVWGFVITILPQLQNVKHNYGRNFWIEQMNKHPELLLYAKDGDTICGSVFGWIDNGAVTIGHCGVDEAYRGKGVGKALMLEAEKRAKALGYHNITLGSVESAEGFYEKLGYTGTLLIQSEKHSIAQLKALNQSYEVIGTNVYDNVINQVYLRLPRADRELQRKYEKYLPGCCTQMTFGKMI